MIRCAICADPATERRGDLLLCSACLASYQRHALGPMPTEVVRWAISRVRFVQHRQRAPRKQQSGAQKRRKEQSK